jgi:hypothetical protein
MKKKRKEELPTPQAERVYVADAPFIDLRDDRERQAYAFLMDRVFANTKEFDSTLLDKTGTNSEFDSMWQALAWEGFVPVQEIGSRPITIQFLYTLQEEAKGITFRFHGMQYRVSWKDLSCTLSFHYRCAISFEQACNSFSSRWVLEELAGRYARGKLTPRCIDITHPTLRLWHKWLTITLFPRDDI